MRFPCGPISLLSALLPFALAAAQDTVSPAPQVTAKGRQLPPAYATRQLDVEIPFTITPASNASAQPAAVQVYVSWDSGRNWRIYTEVSPDAGKFRFKAKKDAEFWFVTETVEAPGRAPSDSPKWPQMRLVIDTQKPDLQATAAANPAGQVDLTWSASDPHLISQSLKIEYQDARDADAPWEPVAIPASKLTLSRGGLAGRISFGPHEGLRAINVRAEVADAAGNKSYFHQQLAIPGRDQRRGGALVDSPLARDAGARRWPSDNRSGATDHGSSGLSAAESIARGPVRDEASAAEIIANPHVRRDRLAASPSRRLPPHDAVPPRDRLPPPVDQQQPPTSNSQSFPDLSPPASISRDQPSAESLPAPRDRTDIGPIPRDEALPAPKKADSSEITKRSPEITTTDSIPAGTQPRLTNSKHLTLDYDVDSVGPEGVAEVELWGTNDGGKSWLKWGTDPDRISPMEVEVSSEATYGFRVVILGKNGLEGNKPEAGDDADIWVNIDVTRPAAHITAAAYGSGENAGKLDIRWEALDANLGQRPVTLLSSDRPEGKFAVIAAGLENTGQYLWQFDPRSPRKIYLRLEVRDDAGNIAIDQLTDPISIEGLIPKGRIRSLSPAPEPLPESGAFSSPLFR